MAYLTDYNTDVQLTAIVKKSTRLTPEDTEEIRELVLEVDTGGSELKPGQSIGVLVKGDDNFGLHWHHRLYSIADLPVKKGNKYQVKILVKRCFYIDDFSGEKFNGIASNYLCDRTPGDEITITGPFGLPFDVPEDKNTDLILIGMGTGIAPFRAFVKHLYKNVKGWKGKVRLFYGARSGLELVYMNNKKNDFANYYDEETFEAFEALSPRPHWSDPIALDYALEQRSEEILSMLNKPKTRIYVAGYEKIEHLLDKAFATILGSEEEWKRKKAELVAGGRWQEIIY
ncbi:MAG TPA: ferredoxin-NADP reductase [Caldithrix abyssi]|uniref:Ferredoxin-NADP reductase n=1 Tax=Caldithrix abyssi TaxID=187145 RepID=A0A7V1PUT7_CALAY|nr:ferredoxin-NADP reductase [Caldithrix abyssi]